MTTISQVSVSRGTGRITRGQKEEKRDEEKKDRVGGAAANPGFDASKRKGIKPRKACVWVWEREVAERGERKRHCNHNNNNQQQQQQQ